MTFPSKPKIGKKSGAVLITLALVAVGFSLYFFVYVEKNRARNTARAYRVLNQMAETVGFIHSSISSNIKDYGRGLKGLQSTSVFLKEDPISNEISYDFSSVLREDVFDQFFIIRQWADKEEILYQSFPSKIVLDSIKTASSATLLTEGTTYQSIEISSDQYRVFTHRLDIGEGEIWTLAGCVNNQRFVRENRKINTWVVLNSGLVIIIVLLSMPILKLILMSAVERLRLTNIFWTGFSIVLGTPLIMLSVLIMFNFLLNDQKTINGRLESLADSVKNDFTGELKTMYDLMATADQQLPSLVENGHLQPGQSTASILEHPGWPDSIHFVDFNEVFWMNDSGQQIYQVTPFTSPNDLINLKDRQYFTQVTDGHSWPLPGDTTRRFGFQSIYSKITGKNEVALSMPSDHQDVAVAAITSKMSSVMDAILPLGYEFCIIDTDGEVLIHLDKSTNLQENFVLETEDNSTIKSALFSYRSLFTNITYHGKEHRAYISPIGNLPLFIVTYYDVSLLKDRITEIWTVALLLLMLSLLLSGVLVLIMALTQFKKTKVHYREFVFDWMTPRGSKLADYRKITLVNVLIGIILFFPSWLMRIENELLIASLLTLPSLIFSLNYFFIYRADKAHTKAISRFLLMAATLFVFYDFYYIGHFRHGEVLIFIQGLIVLFYLTEFRTGIFTRALVLFGPLTQWISEKVDNVMTYLQVQPLHFYESISTSDLKVIYSRMLLIWLIITSLLPVIIIYKMSYWQESELWSKHNLLDLSYRMDNKVMATQDEYQMFLPENSENTEAFIQQKIHGGNHIDFMVNQESSVPEAKPKSGSLQYDNLIFYGRPILNRQTALNRALTFSSSSNELYDWKYFQKEGRDHVLLTYHSTFEPGTSFLLSKEIESIRFISLVDVRFFVFVLPFLVLIIFALYKLISFCLERIYSMEGGDLHENSLLSPEEFKSLASGSNVIFIGVPGSGKSKVLEQCFRNTRIIDCLSINNQEHWKSELVELEKKNYSRVIVENFEYGIRDHETNERKRKLLELLIRRRIRIVIVTEVHPLEIVKNYERSRGQETEESLESSYKNTDAWRHILSGFVDVYQPLIALDGDESKKSQLTVIDSVVDNLLKEGAKPEDKILIRQIHAQSYYYAIWNTLNKEERFVVFDLADDNFVNVRNKDTMYNLARKGLVKFEDGWKLFSHSFANFILTSVAEEEAEAMRQEENLKGEWINIRNPIIIVVISLLILISFGDPDFFANINAVVIAITGVASLLPTLNGIVSFTEKIREN